MSEVMSAVRAFSFARSFVVSFALVACKETQAPERPLPAALDLLTNLSTPATVGTSAGPFTVRVKDASGAPLSGVLVTFAVSLGGGHVNPTVDTSEADGSASTLVTVGNVTGQNEVTATVAGVNPVRSVTVAGVPGAPFRITMTRRAMRFLVTTSSLTIGASARDSIGNNTGQQVTWVSRNPALVSVTPGAGNNASVQVVSRPGQTYLVATAAGASDSIPVAVLDGTSTPCTFAASPTTLPVGGTVSFEATGVVCIRSEESGAEYAVISHYGTPASNAIAVTEWTGTGISQPAPIMTTAGNQAASGLLEQPDVSFEHALRERERREIGSHVDGARSWYASRPLALTATAREGDVVATNVNAFTFCSTPVTRWARVVAITSSAVILADTANPPGGFTDAEYRAYGIALDTLVSPVDTAAFGSPSDIDNNGRVVVLFTSAVNDLTPRGALGGVVLGFFYSRDLLPRISSTGACPGSNVGEMFYVMVPDPGAYVSDARSKVYVDSIVVSTIAHEFQHLINASRRLYDNQGRPANEELWLNEGLSHIAEELVFYRASALSPRQNIGPAELQSGTAARSAFDVFLRGNFTRYLQYLRAPELNSPIASEDFVATRGATWSFLRYLADRAGSSDGDLWRRLVNSPLAGVDNVNGALATTGLTVLDLLRDWSVSILADDDVPGLNAPFQQASWNFVDGMPAVGIVFGLAPGIPSNALTSTTSMRAGGSSYKRFAVPQGQEALVQVTGVGARPVPQGVRLTVVRTR